MDLFLCIFFMMTGNETTKITNLNRPKKHWEIGTFSCENYLPQTQRPTIKSNSREAKKSFDV